MAPGDERKTHPNPEAGFVEVNRVILAAVIRALFQGIKGPTISGK